MQYPFNLKPKKKKIPPKGKFLGEHGSIGSNLPVLPLSLQYFFTMYTKCNEAHQKGETLQVESILSSLFAVLEFFLSFKVTPHLSKLIEAFTFCN